ncbi:hypothetical protein AB2L27_18490 [Kineococcus sp. LSe6-4]|uniref:DUF222 domain-containing protein n=1 Tax=Kineococcus halophytocola TaxID=3234027 RepID=A0ABV4H599_9ACTN
MTAPVHTGAATEERVPEHWATAWDAALAAVELDVESAERLIAQLHAGVDEAPEPADRPWVAPALLGPIPLEFADRARHLLARQTEVSERLAEAMVTVRSQTRALGKLDRAERRPVFLDRAL